MGGEECNTIFSSDSPTATLLHALEERGVIQPSNVDRLEEAFLGLKLCSSFYHAVNMYQKLRDQITSYDRFLANLSAHLTSSLPADLCDYFHVSDEQKNSIITSENPGLSFLLALDEIGIIEPSEVGCLEEPFNKFNLVQALAKILEYKEILKEENRQSLQTSPHSLEDKRAMFVEFLKKKIKSWYETMTPVPWKKSCQWKSSDLFVGRSLILTDSKAKQSVHNIDEQCKLNYTAIFSHEKLKSEIRIILEGDPGAGKTMLSSQLAYDWSEGKIDGVDILVFLPLKIVEDKTLIQAIEEFYIPTKTPLSGNDIESILASDTEKLCLLLDGLEEYSTGGRMKAKESSEVMKTMKKEKHSNCKVVVTSRSDFAHDLPEYPLLKLGRFGETERNSYIEKLFSYDTDKQKNIKRALQDNPFILDLCIVPLLFVLAVHNIESMSLSKEGQLNKVSSFMRSMILTLCSSSTVKHEVDGIRSKSFKSEKMTLEELAFNGLCKGHQQLSWQKDFMESNVGSLRRWIDSGILVLEEGLVISEKENQGQEKKGNPEEYSSKNSKEKKKTKKGKVVKSEFAPDEILMEEFSGPSTRHDIPQLPILSEDVDMVTASVGELKAGHEVSEIEEQHQRVSELITDPKVIKKKTVRRAAGQVPLVVKFLHKVIQEWFAATFFCSMMRRCTSEEQFQNYVSSQLQHLSPTDLHYVLCFTCYLHPPSCHVIMNYLLRNYRKDGSVPPYIMNCVFLCFNEHNDVKGPHMRNAVIDVCKEVMKIQSEDSRLLQQAKSSLLAYASNDGVIIEKLELKDVISAVDNTSLTLNSGVQLGILHTVKMIEVSRWDQVLQENDFKNILKLLSAGKLVKEVCCIFPSQPPDSLDEVTLKNIVSKDLKVEWHIGHFAQVLDPREGKWMMDLKQSGTSSTEIKEVSADQGSAKNEEEMRRNTTSSLPSTSAESSKYLHTQGTLKRIVSDPITGFAVPENKEKVALEEPAVSDIAQGVLQAGTVRKGEFQDVKESHFEEDAVASGFEQRTLTEENSVSDVIQVGLRQGTFQKAASVNRVTPMSFPGEASSEATQRTVCGDASAQKAVQEHAPVLGDVPCHKTECQSLLETKAAISKAGGALEIPNTSAALIIPTNALPNHIEHCEIRVRVIPPDIIKEGGSFSSNSSTILELLPNNLKFQRPLRLTLPHCLVLRETGERKARIFISHHAEGSLPEWEEQTHLSYHLEDTTCIILLDSLCWVKISIDDEIVKAKKLVVYTAARKLQPQDKVAEIHVGYYLDLPGQKQVVQDTQDLIIAHRKTFFFVKTKEKYPLCLTLDNIFPSGWQHKYMELRSRKITYEQIELYGSHSLIYHIERTTSKASNPLCIFTVSQENRQISVQLAIHLKIEDKNPLTSRALDPSVTLRNPSPWEEQPDIKYELEEDTCIIHLKQLCCVKYYIDTAVKAKKIVLYTAAKTVKQKDELAEVEVGYYSDIPGGGELLRLNPDFHIDSKRLLLCMEKEKYPLQVSLESILPQHWTCWVPKETPQEIPFNIIASSIEHSHLYVLQKGDDQLGSVICHFSAVQRGDPMPLSVRLYPQEDHSNENAQRLQEEAKADSMTIVFKYLSETIGDEWRHVGRELKLQDAQLGNIRANYPCNRQEAIYQMLLTWKRSQGSKATYNILIKALEQSGRKDLAENV